MKKVALTFIVKDKIVNRIMTYLTHGDMDKAANILNDGCDESDYDIEDIS